MTNMDDDAELMDLQRQLAAAQMATTSHRISERHAVDILQKLMSQHRVDLIVTTNGREYVTPQQLRSEIDDELQAAGGRISTIDLLPLLNVDLVHIEAAVNKLVASNRSLQLLDGTIITSYYLDGIIEEINQQLDDAGQLAITSMSAKYQLPATMVMAALEQRNGTIFFGRIQGSDLYTELFVQRHNARVRGILMGVTRPTVLRTLVTAYQLLDELAFTEAKRLCATKEVSGTIKGSETRAIYVPDMFARGQDDIVTTFYRTNHFIDFERITRLQIAGDAPSYLARMFPDGVKLVEAWIDAAAMVPLQGMIDEAINHGTWITAAPLLPSGLSRVDVAAALKHCVTNLSTTSVSSSLSSSSKSKASQQQRMTIIADVYGITGAFSARCLSILLPAAQQLGVAAAIASYQSAAAGTPTTNDDSDHDNDDDIPSSSTLLSKKTSSKSGGSSGGSGKNDRKAARQERAKAGGKGQLAKKQLAAAITGTGGISRSTSKDGSSGTTLERTSSSKSSSQLNTSELVRVLRTELKQDDPLAGDVPVALLTEIVTQYHTRLLVAYRDGSQVNGAPHRRSKHDATSEVLQRMVESVAVFHSAAIAFDVTASSNDASNAASESLPSPTSSTSLARKESKRSKSATKGSDTTSTVDESSTAALPPLVLPPIDNGAMGHDATLSSLLQRHLLKTLCTSIVDVLLRYEAYRHDFPLDDDDTKSTSDTITVNTSPLTPSQRDLIITHLPAKSSVPLTSLVSSLTAKTSSMFVNQLSSVCQSCSIYLRVIDRKKETDVIARLRRQFMDAAATDDVTHEALIMYTILIVLSRRCGHIIHAPLKSLGRVLKCLATHIPSEQHALLTECYQLVTRLLSLRRAAKKKPSAATVDDAEDAVDEVPADIATATIEQITERLTVQTPSLRQLAAMTNATAPAVPAS